MRSLIRYIITLLAILHCAYIEAQSLSVNKLLKYWSATDTSQSRKAWIGYQDILDHGNAVVFLKKTDSLNTYLSQKHNPRHFIRATIYYWFGRSHFRLPASTRDSVFNFYNCVTALKSLNDEQLLSDLYSMGYWNGNMSAKMLYDNMSLFRLLRSIEIQLKIGPEHFPDIAFHMEKASQVMLTLKEYRQAITIGVENTKTKVFHTLSPHNKILQYDIIGAAYRNLNMPDSCIFYYKKILNLTGTAVSDTTVSAIWTAIANGGIAQGYYLKGNSDAAIPLLEQNITTSVQYKLFEDAALAQGALAKIYYDKKNYSKALPMWKQAYEWLTPYGDDVHITDALHDIYTGYKALHQNDSAIAYFEKYDSLKSILNNKIQRSQVSLVLGQLEAADLKSSLDKTTADFELNKRIWFIIVLCVVIVLITIIMLYNRNRLKNKNLQQQLEQRKTLSEIEAAHAKEVVAAFTWRIIEKDRLISQLEERLFMPSSNQEEVNGHLRQYTLLTDEEWEKFRKEFILIHPQFFVTLRKQSGALTPAEERLSALIYLDLNNQQIANALGIAKDSVARGKRRLKQKLLLEEETSLESYIQKLI